MGTDYKKVDLPICVICGEGIRGVQYIRTTREERRPRGQYLLGNDTVHRKCKIDKLMGGKYKLGNK